MKTRSRRHTTIQNVASGVTHLQGGPIWKSKQACHARLLYQVDPLCKWVTPDAIFCVVVWRLLCVFVLFRSCSSEMYKTRK